MVVLTKERIMYKSLSLLIPTFILFILVGMFLLGEFSKWTHLLGGAL